MARPCGPASWRQATRRLNYFREHHLPDLLEDHYGEWALLDAASGEFLGVYPAPKAFALSYERPSGEVLLEQVCEQVPMVVGGAVIADLKERESPVRKPRLRHDDDFGQSATTSVIDGFVETLTTDADLLREFDAHDAKRLGPRAASQVLAAARWSQVVGDRLDTTRVTRLLGVTRQALAKRQQTGSLLGLPGDGTT